MAEQNTTGKLTLAKFEEAYDIVQKVVLPTKLINRQQGILQT